MKIIRIIKYIFITGITATLLFFGIIYLSDHAVKRSAGDLIYEQAEEVPPCESALVLGTSQLLRSGAINPYFRHRIEAAAELYHSGKMKYLIVSGDNSRSSYNEPLDMKNALVEAGVPENAIYLDYAGFRTLDSVVRMKEIFSQERFLIVSQKFHNERAICIARRYGLEVYGYKAQDVGYRFGLRVRLREKLARVKVFTDILIGKKPRFLGEKVQVGGSTPLL